MSCAVVVSVYFLLCTQIAYSMAYSKPPPTIPTILPSISPGPTTDPVVSAESTALTLASTVFSRIGGALGSLFEAIANMRGNQLPALTRLNDALFVLQQERDMYVVVVADLARAQTRCELSQKRVLAAKALVDELTIALNKDLEKLALDADAHPSSRQSSS
jgi:hypothetical protein